MVKRDLNHRDMTRLFHTLARHESDRVRQKNILALLERIPQHPALQRVISEQERITCIAGTPHCLSESRKESRDGLADLAPTKTTFHPSLFLGKRTINDAVK